MKNEYYHRARMEELRQYILTAAISVLILIACAVVIYSFSRNRK